MPRESLPAAAPGPPRIVRLHGQAQVVRPGERDFDGLTGAFSGAVGVGVRSIIVVDVRRVADSCGYGVPFMAFERHRPTMDEWTARKGADGIREYWSTHNQTSIDGLTGLDDRLSTP